MGDQNRRPPKLRQECGAALVKPRGALSAGSPVIKLGLPKVLQAALSFCGNLNARGSRPGAHADFHQLR